MMNKKFWISLITLLSITACVGLNNKLLENEKKEIVQIENTKQLNETQQTAKVDEKSTEVKETKEDLGPIIRVRLSYSPNSKIVNKGDISYINGKPYHGKIYVYKGNVINELPLEQYLYSVISSEVPYNYPKQALEAQAIVCRTYALYSIQSPRNEEFNLYDDFRSQVYGGISKEHESTTQAINDTRGNIITYKDHEPILAMFFSSIGARTLSAKEVFGRDYPYLRSVSDSTTNVRWTKSIKAYKFYAKLGLKKAYPIKQIGSYVYIGKRVYTTNKLRSIFGESFIRSNNYRIYYKGSYIVFSGYGYGHGVGLSQVGAKNMALKGANYETIIKHYYKGTSIWKKY